MSAPPTTLDRDQWFAVLERLPDALGEGPAALLDLHFALYETRRVNPDFTVSFLGRAWQITATARRKVTIVHLPGKRFWVISEPPTMTRPQWPDILASYTL